MVQGAREQDPPKRQRGSAAQGAASSDAAAAGPSTRDPVQRFSQEAAAILHNGALGSTGAAAISNAAATRGNGHAHHHQDAAAGSSVNKAAGGVAAALPAAGGIAAASPAAGGTSTANPAAAAAAQGGTPCPGPLDGALSSFKSGVLGLQGLLSGLVAEAEAERAALQAARAALDAERHAFEQERQRVAQVLSNGDQVMLNVGGAHFTTSITTLRNAPAPSLFSAMFSGRHALTTGPDGAIFLDRDGRHFHDILNYLRDGQLAYPPDGSDYKYLLELRSEAEFYGLSGLVDLINAYPWNITRVQRCMALNQEDSWMYEDGQDEVVLRVDRPCQLLGVGLCGTDTSYTVEMEVVHVDSDDYSSEVARLASAAQTFTKADGITCRLMLKRPVQLLPGQHYMLSALIKGQDSYCCEECLETVVAGGVKVQFQAWESPNGTNEGRGQFPELYIRPN